MKIHTLFICMFTFFSGALLAQSVGIGTTTPNISAQLDVSSNTKGILIPRMTEAEKNAIPSPAQGLMIFNTSTNSFQYFNSSVWINVSNSGIISGTVNKVAKFNSPWGLTNSLITDNGAGVSINSSNAVADASALLDLASTTKGVLIPRMNTAQRTAIATPAKALMLYDTTTRSFWFHDGVQWIEDGRINVANNNTYLGYQADNNNSAGTLNTGIGAQALFSNGTGSFNTATGVHAMYLNTTGTSNTADGSLTLEFNTTGNNNTAMGSNALSSNTTGNENTALGYNAMDANTTGNYNTSVGVTSMRSNTSGNYNTANGHQALYSNTTGYDNVAIGRNAMVLNQTGYSNVAVGSGALSANSSGSNIVAIGDSALFHYNSNGADNVAIGSKALYNNSSGQSNTAVGRQTLYNSNADNNTALGFQALYSNTTGTDNTATGDQVMFYNTIGTGNVAMGSNALQSNLAGTENVAVGHWALGSNLGTGNIGIGSYAIANFTAGSGNIGIGRLTNLQGNSSNNTLIGTNGGVSGAGNYNYVSTLGAQAIANCSNCTILGGDDPTSRTRVAINISTPATDLHIIQQSDNVFDVSRGIRLQRPNGNQWRTFIDPSNDYVFQLNNALFSYIEPVGGTFISNSDERLKKDIQPMEDALGKLLLLKPKTYHYTFNDDHERRLYGFIAQDVEKLFPEFVFTSEAGLKGIAYSNFSVVAIKALQEQELKIETQQNENEQLKKELLQQQQLLADITRRLEELEKNKK